MINGKILYCCLFAIITGIFSRGVAAATVKNDLPPVRKATKSIGIKVIGEKDDLQIPLEQARKKIFRAWFAPTKPRPARPTILVLTLSKDGKLSKLKVHQSSLYPLFDESAVRGVEKALPFSELLSKKQITLEFFNASTEL